MMTFAEACVHLRIADPDLEMWIAQEWIRPTRGDRGWIFDDVDVARLQLIADLRGPLAVNEEAMPVVLGLLDQLYATREALHTLGEALAHLPDETVHEIARRIEAARPDKR